MAVEVVLSSDKSIPLLFSLFLHPVQMVMYPLRPEALNLIRL
jgi:hypothetical protein